MIHINMGDLVTLQSDGIVMLCDTPDTYSKMWDAIAASDPEGLAELEGKIQPLKNGTTARVLKFTGPLHGFEIRILDGEYKGQRGIVSSDWMTKVAE
jgi:hypothetical protein